MSAPGDGTFLGVYTSIQCRRSRRLSGHRRPQLGSRCATVPLLGHCSTPQPHPPLRARQGRLRPPSTGAPCASVSPGGATCHQRLHGRRDRRGVETQSPIGPAVFSTDWRLGAAVPQNSGKRCASSVGAGLGGRIAAPRSILAKGVLVRRHKTLLPLAVLGFALLAWSTSARAEPENPKLRRSWLVPTACPFCDWGAQCGCTPQ